MNTDVVVAFLGAGGLGAIIASIVAGLFSKRKLGAEATEIITKAAAGVVENLNEELARTREQMRQQAEKHDKELHTMARAMVREREEWHRVLQLHVAWDAIAIAKLAEFDVDLPDIPPVTPSVRHVGPDGYPLNRPQHKPVD